MQLLTMLKTEILNPLASFRHWLLHEARYACSGNPGGDLTIEAKR